MKKILVHFLILIMIVFMTGSARPVPSYAATRKLKTRTIHIVYDDSGSMIDKNSSWSQAKYALEVFAAMMGENDSVVVYPMSAFSYKNKEGEKSGNWNRTISLSGSMSIDDRISAIRRMNGDNGVYRNTPIQTVRKAGEDLEKAGGDEKWLLILTDGDFDNGHSGADPSGLSTEEMNRKDEEVVKGAQEFVKETIMGFSGKSGIHVYFVGFMGKNVDPLSAAGLSNVSGSDTFYKESADKTKILATITRAARTIYNLQAIPVKKSGKVVLQPDIPVSKFIVFAQGDDVETGDIQFQNQVLAAQVDRSKVEVSAATDEHPQNNDPKNRETYADNLKGEITAYSAQSSESPFPAGAYSFSCKSDTLEVYFEPGVDIQVLMHNEESGEEYNLSEGVDYLEEGHYTVKVRMVNPLTGEIIDQNSSDLLSGCEMSAVITSEKGTAYYRNGDTVDVASGDIQIQGRAVFKDDSEKTSNVSEIHVGAGGLIVLFGKNEYLMDPLHLADSDIEIEVLDKNREPLSEEEYRNLQISAGGLQGISCVPEAGSKTGCYRICTQCGSDNGIAAIGTSTQSLTVSAALDDNGHSRVGTASAAVSFKPGGPVHLQLTMIPPEPSYDGGTYMFDADSIGKGKEKNYIQLLAEVQEEDGSLRPLTSEEWARGLSGFDISSKGISQSFIWRFIEFTNFPYFRQFLDFRAEKGDEISQYKLYIENRSARSIRPNTSELTIDLEIALDNGILEEGSVQGTVTVRPMGGGIWDYILAILITAAVLAAVLVFAFLEWRKPRIPRNLTLLITCAAGKLDGVLHTDSVPNNHSSIKIYNRVFPLTAPETGVAKIHTGGSGVLKSSIPVKLTAERYKGRIRYVFTNARTAFPEFDGNGTRVGVLINGIEIKDLPQKVVLNSTSLITIQLTGLTEGNLGVQLIRKNKEKKKRRIKGRSRKR